MKIAQMTFLRAVVIGALVIGATSVSAAPFTHHFDDLIVELQTRSAMMTNKTNKVEQKQLKVIQSVLKTLGKNSTSLATDIKTAGTVIKSLIKAFPSEFTQPPASAPFAKLALTQATLPVLLQALLDLFKGDEVALLAAAQAELDTLPAGTCKTSAQATLDTAAALLATTPGAPDLVALSAILVKGAKDIVISEGSVAKAIACANSGGGGGGGCATATTFTADASGRSFVGAGIQASWSSAGGGPGSLVINATAADGSSISLNLNGCECPSDIGGISSMVLSGAGVNAGRYGFSSGTAIVTHYHSGSIGPACGTFTGIAADSSNPAHTISVTGNFTVLSVTVHP